MTYQILSEKGVFCMYIKKSVLATLTALVGMIVLIVLSVMFCFTEIEIPVQAYAVGWFGCLFLMQFISAKIYR